MDILFTIDNDYVPHLSVTITSILKNNKGERFSFHIISNSITDTNKNLLIKIFKREKINFIFYKFTEKESDFIVSGHASSANYYRLFLTKYLPHDISKILYLDSDLININSLDPFWNIDIKDFALAAVKTNNHIRAKELGLQHDNYFNSGVMLINVEYWRKENAFSKFLQFIKDHPKKIKFWDQDVLNYIFQNKVLFIPDKYNQPKNEKITKNTVILHFTGKLKPWHIHYPHINRKYYINFALQTQLGRVVIKRLIREFLTLKFTHVKKVFATKKN